MTAGCGDAGANTVHLASALTAAKLGSHAGRLQASGPPDLLRDGDHHPRVRAGVRADGAGGQAVPSARVDEDVRDGRFDVARGDARARAVQPAGARAVSQRGPQHHHAAAAQDLRSGAELGVESSQDRHRRGGDAAGDGVAHGVWLAARLGERHSRCRLAAHGEFGARLRQGIHAAAERRQFALHARDVAEDEPRAKSSA